MCALPRNPNRILNCILQFILRGFDRSLIKLATAGARLHPVYAYNPKLADGIFAMGGFGWTVFTEGAEI